MCERYYTLSINETKPEYGLLLLSFLYLMIGYDGLLNQLILGGKYTRFVFAEGLSAIIFGIISIILALVTFYIFFNNFINHYSKKYIDDYILWSFYLSTIILATTIPIKYIFFIYNEYAYNLFSFMQLTIFIFYLINIFLLLKVTNEELF